MKESFAQRDIFWQELKENKRNLFSFLYDGKQIFSTELDCKINSTRQTESQELTELEYFLTDSGISFKLKFKIFKNFPYIEYEAFVHNSGDSKSGIIEEIKTLDLQGIAEQAYYGVMTLPQTNFSHAGNRLKVSYYLGTFCTAHDFIRIDRRLYPQPGEDSLQLNSESLTRTSERALPFFRVDFDDLNGYDIGVGWSGGWKADFSLKSETSLINAFKYGKTWKVNSGLQRAHFCVEPNETLRLPGYFIGFRNNVTVRNFINTHRRFMLTHHAPYDSKGKLLLPPLSMISWGGSPTEDMKKSLLLCKEKELPFEVHWIDAGWQGHDGPCPHFCDLKEGDPPSDWPIRVGNNRINNYAHPNGMSEIADFARECGLKTMLWFELERCHRDCGSPIIKEHPEWFLDNQFQSLIYNLGNDEACDHITNWVLEFLENERIEYYRQDQNINFYEFWAAHDAPDRVGVHEMKHINNLYRFWRTLREKRPDMIIDNCASGGRRLDYMLATYSFPLCQSDYETFMDFNYSCLHLENFYLNEVYPLHSLISWMPNGDSYAMLSSGCGTGVASCLWHTAPALKAIPQNYDFDSMRKHLFAIKEMRQLLIDGNYYQLTKDSEDLSQFCAMQAHDEAKKSGYVLIFSRPETEDDEFIAILNEIDSEATYEVRDFASNTTSRIKGSDFRYIRKKMAKRSVLLYFYKQI
ncbi:MAG: alpha-galactosidase [Lentisphaeria bacterium]|nr:alpha-galactosidase [Lentisphaeria bacterium]